MTPDICAAIHAECFTSPRPWSAAEFISLLDSANVFLCSADAGFALGRIAGPEAELLTIAVAPEARRAGLGARLLAQFEEQANTRGAEELFLEVAADNTAAINLYSRAGFTQCGHRKDYYETPKGPRISALVFQKLTPPSIR